MLDYLRKRMFIWLLKTTGFDRLLEKHGVHDFEDYYKTLLDMLNYSYKQHKYIDKLSRSSKHTNVFTDKNQHEYHHIL